MSGGVLTRRGGLALYALVAICATVLGLVVLGLVGNMASTPLTYSGDGIIYSTLIKGIVDNGQVLTNPRLGAPGVSQFYDFPGADGIFTAEIWLIALFTSNYVLVLNLFALLTYPLIALSATWAIRRLGFSRASAFVFGLLYALLPFHQARITSHVYLAAYFVVPLAITLVAEVGFGREPAADRLGWFERSVLGVPTWGWFAAVVIGSSGVYYAFFCLALLLPAGALSAFAHSRLRRLAAPVLAAAAIVLVLAAQSIPSQLYWQQAGGNSLAQSRVPSDSDLFALRMTELVFPMTNHRLSAFASIKSLYVKSLAGITENYASIAHDSSLGLVGVFGFFVLLFWAVASPLRAPPREPHAAPPRLAVMGLGAFLLATVGGIGEIIAYLGFPQIRAYDRITVYLGFLSLCAAAWVADATARRISESSFGSPRARQAVVVACFSAVLVLGFLDQTSPGMVPDYGAIKIAFDSDQAYVRQVEAGLPKEAAVFQLPYVQFPESPPVGRTGGYDPLRMYLHSEGLRWSAGASMGRSDAAWQQRVSQQPVESMIAALRGKGFDGIQVDRFGYADGGVAFEASITDVTGVIVPVISPDGRYAFYRIAQ